MTREEFQKKLNELDGKAKEILDKICQTCSELAEVMQERTYTLAIAEMEKLVEEKETNLLLIREANFALATTEVRDGLKRYRAFFSVSDAELEKIITRCGLTTEEHLNVLTKRLMSAFVNSLVEDKLSEKFYELYKDEVESDSIINEFNSILGLGKTDK